MKILQIKIILTLLFFVSDLYAASQSLAGDTLRNEVVLDLKENILPFWENHAVDPSGGFYGMLMPDGTPRPDARKGEVLNARILWTFSTSYRLFGNEKHRILADRAQRYFIDHFTSVPLKLGRY